MIDRFNYISSWVATTICTAENIKDRKRVLKRFIDITISLKQIHNYNGMMEIWSGISRGPIYRLKRTLSGLKKNYLQKFTELQELTDSSHNYKNLRACIRSADPPIIPYLGMYLTDLTFIEEGNKTLVSVPYEDTVKEMINYYKSRLVYQTIDIISMYQQKGYTFQVVKIIQDKIASVRIITDENVLYSISEYIEPRQGHEPSRPPILDTFNQNKYTSPAKVRFEM